MEVFIVVWKNVPVVGFLLFLISTISFAIFFERWVNIKKSKILPQNWNLVKAELKAKRYEVVISLLKKNKSPLAKTLVQILEAYRGKHLSKFEIYQILDKELEILYQILGRGINFISLSVTLATLLGLLGTVWGLIEVFGAYSLLSSESLKLLAKGIATSLNSTAAGLLIAVISYILYWLLRERINAVYTKIVKEIEEFLELLG